MRKPVLEIVRYAINGLIATSVHYAVLTANLNLLAFKYAGWANFVAAIFGITISFFGSRYFVFKQTEQSVLQQAIKFCGIYTAIAVLHGLILWVWTDLSGLDYRAGFLIATFVQVSLSYLGNKFVVFKA